MEKENRIISSIEKKATPEIRMDNPKFDPANFTYHPDMTRAEVIAVLDYERGRFFRDWGNV